MRSLFGTAAFLPVVLVVWACSDTPAPVTPMLAASPGASHFDAASLVSYWPADGNAFDLVGDNNGTPFGAVSFTTGIAGQAFSFDGVNDYVDVSGLAGDLSRFNNTVELWVRPAITMGPGSPVQFFFAQWHRHYIAYNDGVLAARTTACSSAGCGVVPADYPMVVPTTLEAGQWHHLALTYRAGDRSALYLNGQLVAERTESSGMGLAWFPSTPAFSLGRIFHDQGSQGYLNGALDEVRVHNTALSAEEIHAIYEGGLAPSVRIDVVPGSADNAVNVASNGVMVVAVLSTSVAAGEPLDFDATTVDPATVRFGPGDATEVHATGHLEDVDRDGDLDLVLHFSIREAALACTSESGRLSGRTFAGAAVRGADTISPRGCH